MENIYKIKLPPSIKNEETIELFKTFDFDAREKIINGNLRLAASISRKYVKNSADQEDLFNIATIGLIKAVDTFDVNRNTEFSTYASKCMENEIRMYLRKEFSPISKKSRALKREILDYVEEVYKKTGYEPTKEEIAKHFGVNIKTVFEVLNTQTICSLDDEITDLDGLTRASAVPSDVNIEETYISNYEKGLIVQLLPMLTSRERLVIELYYGINCKPLVQTELSKVLNLSRSYIGRLINRGINNMKIYSDKEVGKDARILKVRELCANASIEEIKSILIQMDEKHRNVFMNLHPLNGNIPASFSEIKNLLGLSYNEILKYDEEAVAMIKKEIEIRQMTQSKPIRKTNDIVTHEPKETRNEEGLEKPKHKEKEVMTEAQIEAAKEVKPFYYPLFPNATREMIEEAVNSILSEKYRTVFLSLYPIDGSNRLTYTQIKEKFGIPIGSITLIIKKCIENVSESLGMIPNSEIMSKRGKKVNNQKSEAKIRSSKRTVIIDKTNVEHASSGESQIISGVDKERLRPLIRMLNDELQETLILLRLGFIRNKQYSNEEISKFLNMSEEDTRIITRYALLRLKEFGEAFSGSSVRISTLIENEKRVK